MADAVRIDGLKAFRRSLRQMQPDTLREVRNVLKSSAEIVRGRAQSNAESFRRTGNLAGSYRAGTAGNTAFVRSRHPGAGVNEYGGVIAPRGVPIRFAPRKPTLRALDATEGQIVDRLSDGIDAVARRNGWR